MHYQKVELDDKQEAPRLGQQSGAMTEKRTLDMTSVDTTIIKRLDKIFSAAPNYEQGAAKMFAEFVVIPRADLPEVEDRGGMSLLVDKHTYPASSSPESLREDALRRLAVADYIEAKIAKVDAAVEKLEARREELADQLSMTGVDYRNVSRIAQRAIDRIIELEEAAA